MNEDRPSQDAQDRSYRHCCICDCFYHPDLFIRSESCCELCVSKYIDNYIKTMFSDSHNPPT